jgi:hypothetical protein
MDVQSRFEQEFGYDQPMLRLRAEVEQLLIEGYDRDLPYSQLDAFRSVLLASGRDADDDVVLEVMDFLTGWCSPDMNL